MLSKTSERERQRRKQAASAAAEREVVIHAPVDLDRRRSCLADPLLFMPTYFGWIFWQPFSEARRIMVESIVHAARYSGDFCVADKRGGGKSKIALFTTFWLDLRCELKLPIIVGKNQHGAENELNNLKQAIVESPDFAADFPEICLPIIALEGWASTARKQTVNGYRTKIGWEKDCLFLPTVPQAALPSDWPSDEPSRACGQGIAVVGIDCKIRGFDRRNIRPDLALIDDIDDRGSARSEVQTADLRVAIDQDISGLAGSGKRIPRVMLCTTINDQCIAAEYTAKASWRGQRFKAISTMPERMDLWEEYIGLRADRAKSDPDARVAHGFFVASQSEMMAGSRVDNELDFVSTPTQDGSPLELCALQHYFNVIADNNWAAFLCEYQNDPPKEDGPLESGISAEKIQRRLSGYPRRTVPPECHWLTRGIDVQQRGLHWVVKAWRSDATNYVVDYGFSDSYASSYEKDQDGVELAIYRTVLALMDESKLSPYFNPDGESVPVGVTLIDSGWLTNAIYLACLKVGLGIYPAKGRGKSQGCVGPTFSPALKKTTTCKPGDGISWRMDKQDKGVWLVNCNADHWKSFEHARWLTSEGKPGAAYLFGQIGDEERKYLDKRMPQDAKDHFAFARHLTAEIEVEDIVRGVLRRIWKVKTGRVQNHYLDASYMADVGAAMLGVKLLKSAGARPKARAWRPAEPIEEVGAR